MMSSNLVVATWDSKGYGAPDRAVVYRVESEGVNVDEALREASKEFLAGPARVLDTMQPYLRGDWSFNWGDAMEYVPTETLARHGISRIEFLGRATYLVDHDDDLGGLCGNGATDLEDEDGDDGQPLEGGGL